MTTLALSLHLRLPQQLKHATLTFTGFSRRRITKCVKEQAGYLLLIRFSKFWSDKKENDSKCGQPNRLSSRASVTRRFWKSLCRTSGCHPCQLRRIAALSKALLIERDNVGSAVHGFPVSPSFRGELNTTKTSSATAMQRTSILTKRAFARKAACVAWRQELHGVKLPLMPGWAKHTSLSFLDVAKERGICLRLTHASRTMIIPANSVEEQPTKSTLESIRSYSGIQSLDGYPSIILRLVKHVREQAIASLPVTAAITAAEFMSTGDRGRLEPFLGSTGVAQRIGTDACDFVRQNPARSHCSPSSGVTEFGLLKGEAATKMRLSPVLMKPFHNHAYLPFRSAIWGTTKVLSACVSCPYARAELLIDAIRGRERNRMMIAPTEAEHDSTTAVLGTIVYGFSSTIKGRHDRPPATYLEVIFALSAEKGVIEENRPSTKAGRELGHRRNIQSKRRTPFLLCTHERPREPILMPRSV